MDFEKFIDIDIIEFLDEQALALAERTEEVREEEFDLYEITKDYTREITEALKEGNLKKAQEIFEDVKEKYTKSPPDSLNKKRLYIIMEEIYEKIKDYENQDESKKNLFETIREYEESGLFSTPETETKKGPETISLILSTIQIKEKELERITSKPNLNHYDFARAIQRYRQLKELIKRIPTEHEKEKAKAYESALTWYYTIKKLKEKIEKAEEQKRKEEEAKQQQEEKPIEEKLAEIRKLKEEIVQSHVKIAELIKKRDLQGSIAEYRKLKSLCEQFPYEMEAEKTALLADALSMYESIKKLKQNLQTEQEQAIKEEKEAAKLEEKEAATKQLILEKLEKLKNHLAEKNPEKAAEEYDEIRQLFKNYKEGSLEEKKALFDQILNAHKDIKQLHEQIKSQTTPNAKDKAMEIREKLNQARMMIEQERLEQATQIMLEAKHRIEMLPQEAFDEKYTLTKEAENLEHQLLFLKNMQRITAITPGNQ